MKVVYFPALVAIAVFALVAPQASANLLTNPGFEDPVTSDGPPFVGFWEAFNGGAGASATNSAVMPRSGAMHLDVSIVNTNNTFAGAFQDVPNLLAGTSATFSGWHKRTNTLDADAEIRIEWRNSVSNTEISRTPNFVPTADITTDYTPFSLTAMVPVGADTARVVYALQTFSGGASNTGTVYLDDMSFVGVPEPTTLVFAGLASVLGISVCRRRR